MNRTAQPSGISEAAKRRFGLLFIGISVLVISIDNTVLNVALPSISRALGASTNELQWILDGYVLVFAALLLTTGTIGDRFGRKRVLLVGLVWFAIGSVIAAISSSTLMLIATRALLGVGGALILPATLSIISATFPPKERPQAIAIWAAIFGLGVGAGPVIGGFLLEHFGWNMLFLINLPTCAIALIGGWLFLTESKDTHAPAFDIPGIVLSIIGLFALVYGIIKAGVEGWTNSTVLIALGIGIGVLALFAAWEARTPNAMLPIRFFRNRSFTVASIAMAMVTFNQFSVLFFLSPYLQTVQGYSTLSAGLRLLPFALTLTIMASQSARISSRIGTKYTVALGITIAALGALFIAGVYKVDTPYSIIFISEVWLGFGVGMVFSPATNSIMGAVPVDKAGVGSAMNDTTRQLGGALGVAVLGTILNITYTDSIATLKTSLPQLSPDILAKLSSTVQAAHVIAATLPPEIGTAIITNADQAYVVGMTHGLTVGGIVMFCAGLFVLAFLPAQVQRSEEAPTLSSVPATQDQAQPIIAVSVGD